MLQLDSVKLKDASDTRWLSHQQAIDAIRRCYVAVVLSLEKEANEKTDATAAGLSMFVRQYDFVACISMLSDALPHLTRLSLVFQVPQSYTACRVLAEQFKLTLSLLFSFPMFLKTG